MIETINKLKPYLPVRCFREMGNEPSPEELAERMLIPEDKNPQSAENRQKANLNGKTPIGDDEIRAGISSNATLELPLDSATSVCVPRLTRVLAGLTRVKRKFCVCVSVLI